MILVFQMINVIVITLGIAHVEHIIQYHKFSEIPESNNRKDYVWRKKGREREHACVRERERERNRDFLMNKQFSVLINIVWRCAVSVIPLACSTVNGMHSMKHPNAGY